MKRIICTGVCIFIRVQIYIDLYWQHEQEREIGHGNRSIKLLAICHLLTTCQNVVLLKEDDLHAACTTCMLCCLRTDDSLSQSVAIVVEMDGRGGKIFAIQLISGCL